MPDFYTQDAVDERQLRRKRQNAVDDDMLNIEQGSCTHACYVCRDRTLEVRCREDGNESAVGTFPGLLS